ncbi:MAG: DUF3365 domain-containing protein [Lachnospiraceae bacterium]|nr:DUF3365 domain-containing protein [Lachnospiraceae bacterium]
MKRFRLREKLIIIIGIMISVVSLAFMIWLTASQKAQMQDEVLEKARVMTREMDAVWKFMAINQDRINYNDEGEYEFKGLYCAIVGKSVGALFSQDSDYIFHYTSLNPRNPLDSPDDFEAGAMRYLAEHAGRADYGDVVDYEGRRVYRYVSELLMEESCLDCHGGPAGEIDETGYPKEGLEPGEVVGAISIIIPMETYDADLRSNIFSGFFFFICLMIAVSAGLYVAVSVLVLNPLSRLQAGVARMAEDHGNVRVEEMKNHSEISELVRCFNEMSRELNAVYENLENQVAGRTRELTDLNRVLEQKQQQLEKVNRSLTEENRSKSDFLAVMTHELRTPLTSTILFTEMLLETDLAENEAGADIVRRIRDNTEHLLNTINNTLNLFRLETSAEEMALEVMDIVDVVSALEERVSPIFAKRGVGFEIDAALNVPLFVADSEMIFHILENLLSNAGKFTQEGGLVRLVVRYREEERRIEIRVEDNGIGIAREDQDRIFDKFIQSDRSVARRYGGSGLGLTLVKKWTELHGGDVSVESVPGAGSVFTVRIPSDLSVPGGKKIVESDR